MSAFTHAIENSAEFEGVLNSIKKGFLPQGVLGLIPVQKSHIVSALVGGLEKKALIVVPDDATAVKTCEDLTNLGVSALHYPARSFSFYSNDSQSYEYEQKRIKVLRRMLDGKCDVVVTSAEAVISYTIPPETLRQKSVLLKKGEETTLENILISLNCAGYTRVDAVEGVGQFSCRGGIVDFFSPDDDEPVRIELWGDTVDTMCRFDVQSQRRTMNIDEILIAPSKEIVIDEPNALIEKIEKFALSIRGKKTDIIREKLYADIDRLRDGLKVGSADKYLPLIYSPATIFDYADNYLLFAFETSGIKDKIASSQKLLLEDIKASVEDGILCKGLDKFTLTFNELVEKYTDFGATYIDNFARGSFDTPVKSLTTFNGNTLPIWNGKLDVLIEDIEPILKKDTRIVVFAGTEKSAKNLSETLNDENIVSVYFPVIPADFPKGAVSVLPGSLTSGFSYPRDKFYVFTYSKVYQSKTRRRNSGFKAKDTIHSLDELRKGDYIVHSIHGIGIFDGITQLEANKIIKDYIKIKYAKSDVLYVPVTQLDLVSKYIGPHEDDGKTLKLNRLGGTDWEKSKSKVRSAVKDMADQLIKLYSERMHTQGFAFSPDIDMQADFERKFEFEETGDQLRSIDEIKNDMEKPYPMDRLLCGDVGFGKTEVALRAVFKCVADGKQCAILVPTTILALQHYQTLMKRFDGFPVEIEMLSRFRTPTQRTKIIKSVNSGFIDIIVGTHSLIAKNVKFKDLGLLIVDEEQRFGVAQKEKIKEKFPGVDVLTLSATPIPRTLNMAMSGIRDMSVIEEAPSDRFPVQTYVVEHNLPLLCEAIEKELRRGGQVYFLHNRVETIDGVALSIKEYLPDARIATAHGKMNEEQLSDIWRDLMNGEIDILVCTTIIETGVDIPNANTLIVENAHRLGLSQLHQIRGRIGRSARRAYAYFTYPAYKSIPEVAQKRLEAIREYAEFGAGFKIALRDMEIRGAGNLLGSQQHGHLDAIGYDLYIKLLNRAVLEEKCEAPKEEVDCTISLQFDAYLPERYVPFPAQRISLYKRIALIASEEDLSDMTDELLDRFGEPPVPVQNLLRIALIHTLASRCGVTSVRQDTAGIHITPQKLDFDAWSELSSLYPGRLRVILTGEPHILLRLQKEDAPLSFIYKLFEKYMEISHINM